MKFANTIIALVLVFVLGVSPVLPFTRPTARNRSALPGKGLRPVAKARRSVPKPVQSPVLLEGQTATSLPDGGVLITGGMEGDGPTRALRVFNTRTGKSKSLPEMAQARAFHSATILPDGRVFVFGGVGKNQRALESGLIVDPVTGDVESARGKLSARAYHTTSLLTDGRVLITGGRSERVIDSAQIWDPRTQTVEAAGTLSLAREKHTATLLMDGNVLIEGGIDESGAKIETAELFNVEVKSFSFTTMPAEQNERPFLAAAIPADNSVEVPVNTKVALRFSQRLSLEAIKQAIKFETAQEGVAVKIVPAENGRLVFINPVEDLRSGTAYQVSVVQPDDGSLAITPASVSFTTATDKEWTNRGNADLDWTPDAESMRGNWQTKLGRSSWEDQLPLEGNPGETALSGRVLTLTGQPLPNVTLSVKGISTRTDNTGRFLLSAPDGKHVLLIDGRTANRPGKTYGIFRTHVDIKFGQTNVLDYTIWMPKLDMAHAVNIPSPNSKEIVITNPSIPGLELRLPAGTVIRDIDGKPVTQISITPIPTDRPPFPLPPNLKVPVFASIQPGGAQVIPPRARLIYPNYNHEAPGKRINFWNYDPEEKGWHIYGQGTVTPDGKQIIPDPGVVIYGFSGIMISDGGFPALLGLEPGDDDEDGDPVDLSTGLFVLERSDLVLPDTIPILLNRTYRPGDQTSRAFGVGSSHPYEMFLWSDNNYQETDLILPNGGRVHYERVSPGTVWWDAIYEHTETPSAFYKSQIYWNGTGWDLRLLDGTVFVFPEYAPLNSIRDRHGNELTITRAFGILGNITQITSPNGRWIQFTYGSGNRVSQARDNSGRTVNYTYDGSGRLWKVTDVQGGVTEYLYDVSHRMLSIKDPRGITYLTNEYDSGGRVIRQTQADSSTYEFDYTLNGSGKITQTEITDPRGTVRRVTFNSAGFTLTDTVALGTAIEQTFTYNRQSGTNLLLNEVDPLGRQTAYTYDDYANITSITLLATTGNAVTTNLTYEPNFHQLATITDPLNHTTTYGYDSQGNLTTVTDALNHSITFAYNTAGQVISVTDPLNNTTQLVYDSGDLATVTDPLGHTSSRYTDIIGRGIITIDSLGLNTTFQYNAANLPTQVTDSRGGVSTFEYDENGNLLSVTDANNNETTFIYDNMDRLEVRTDPLSRSESYEYDDNGNVTKYTDRRGKVTTNTYDALDRVTFTGYGTVVNGGSTTYESTVTHTYDAAGRVQQIVDSQTGTITYTYDGFDRLTSEASPRGTVTYTYDTAGRPASMTVSGRSAVNYTYDNADRLTGITQGSSSATYAYDNANRRTSLTLPNGLVTEYGYDVGSNLTSITYKQGATVLGDLTYEYDAARRRTKTGGSYARTNLPSTFNSVTYGASNQLTQLASTNLTYDSNGNLTNDGTNTYTWDARNQLTSISGGTSASFAYDPLGRRTSKTVSSQTTEYLYDGLDVVQELSGGTPNNDMLNGAEVDEKLTCNCNGASRNLLSDVLKNTVALSNSSGTVETEYTYSPFGAASSSGTSSSNVSQFTGRDNDATGLHYFRARYYSPALQRFISEDPLGFGGGDSNFYAYIGNSPTNGTDPTGTNPVYGAAAACIGGALMGAAFDAVGNALLGRKITFENVGNSLAAGCISGLIGFGLFKAYKMLRGLGRVPRPPRTPLPKPNRNCFVAGTMIATADGEKPIEEIAVGDVVLAADPSLDDQASPPQEGVVVQTFVREVSEVLDIRVSNETITATSEHPFWVVDQGWTPAQELKPGSPLVTKNGAVLYVDSIVRRQGNFKVYNFEVAGMHTYFVSCLGLLVHNQSFLTERAARREAFRKNNVPTSKPNNFTREPVYGKNPNLKGPRGEPSEVIKTTDVNGKPVTIQHHKHGHVFRDVNPPVTEGPHYLGPDGINIFYPWR